MNIFALSGVAVGMMVGVIIIVALFKFANTNRAVKTEYDERQLVLRYKGYRVGFYTMLVYEIVMINNRRRYVIVFAVMFLINAVPVVNAVSEGTMFKDGKLSTASINLMVTILILAIGAVLLIKQLADKKAQETEE